MLILGVVLLVMAALMHFTQWSVVATCAVVGGILVVLALLIGERWTLKQ
jgi:hypothetical protein